jgi:hypothetical protein
MTLIRIVIDTVAFIFLVASYLLIMGTIFCILYANDGSGSYVTIGLSTRTMFDAMMANYSYTSDTSYIVGFSILMIIHVFISNIFLVNYLVAILSTVYEIMRE